MTAEQQGAVWVSKAQKKRFAVCFHVHFSLAQWEVCLGALIRNLFSSFLGIYSDLSHVAKTAFTFSDGNYAHNQLKSRKRG